MKSISKGFEITISKGRIVVLVSCDQRWCRHPTLCQGKPETILAMLLELIDPVKCGSGKIQNPFARAELNFCLLCNGWLMMDQRKQGCVLHLESFPVRVLVCAEL